MSRGLTNDMVTEVTATELRPIILIEAEFDSGNLYLWSGIGELSYNSNTYTGAGNLLNVSSVEEKSEVEARGAVFTLTGLNSAILSLAFNEDYQGRPITMKFAVLDNTDTIIPDPVILFKGFMDILQIDESGETATLSMQAENRLIDLKRAKVRRYTPEDQKQQYPTDLGLDFIASLVEKEITWGKDKV